MYKVGQAVVYNTTEENRKLMELDGCNVQQQLPGVICAVWGDTPESVCNVKIFMDGTASDRWKTSIPCGTEEGQFELV